MTRTPRIASRCPSASARILLLSTAFLMAAGIALPSSPEAPPGASSEAMHHEAHGEVPTPAPEHVHPAAEPAERSDVGLEERLGESIPLDLSFRDEAGRSVTLGELITVPTVIAPVYYNCPNVCSFLQGSLAEVLPDIKLDPGKTFRVLSVSFDETETPELARRAKSIYMDAMREKFPPAAWSFLTGERKNIRELLDAAGFRFRREGEDFLHPVAIFVVTADGKIVRYLHGTSILPMDLTLALVEASEGRIGPTIRRVAQFCFSYDAENRRYVFNLFRVSATVILLVAAAFMAFLILRGRKLPGRPR